MDKQQREKWLNSLTIGQLRALASQNRMKEWKTLDQTKLISILSSVEGVEQPQSASSDSYKQGQQAIFASIYGAK